MEDKTGLEKMVEWAVNEMESFDLQIERNEKMPVRKFTSARVKSDVLASLSHCWQVAMECRDKARSLLAEEQSQDKRPCKVVPDFNCDELAGANPHFPKDYPCYRCTELCGVNTWDKCKKLIEWWDKQKPTADGSLVEELKKLLIPRQTGECWNDCRFPVELEQILSRHASKKPADDGSLVEEAVNKFLQWKLPKDFCPDNGIFFRSFENQKRGDALSWPICTNLFTATQAKQMFTACLSQYKPTDDGSLVEIKAWYSAHFGKWCPREDRMMMELEEILSHASKKPVEVEPLADSKFIAHIQAHLKEGEKVVCKICGKTAEEITALPDVEGGKGRT